MYPRVLFRLEDGLKPMFLRRNSAYIYPRVLFRLEDGLKQKTNTWYTNF